MTLTSPADVFYNTDTSSNTLRSTSFFEITDSPVVLFYTTNQNNFLGGNIMSCKAAIYIANTTAQTLAAGATIALGTIVRRFGNDRCGNPTINLSGNGITLNECGYYKVSARVIDAPTAAGTVTVTLLQDGVAIPGAVGSNTAAAATNPTGVTAGGIVRVVGSATSVITAVLTTGAGSVSTVSIDVEKL